ncbi:MAG: ABC transporter permease [Actinobacteria bacterium]|nr:ABC transporter permease [Actinomycetota bacterium]
MLAARAFIERDFLTNVSYRVSFVMQFAGILFQVAMFYFMAQVFGAAVIPSLQAYGGNYFTFLLIGIAFSSYLWLGLGSFSGSIREGQGSGTLELMLLSPTRLSTILMASSLWGYLFTSFRVLLYLLVGIALFGVRLGNANVPAALAVLLVSVVCFASIGILSASFIMVLKKGDPIVWAFGSLSGLLSGVYYPVGVLPDWLQATSRFLPLTYSLEGMRLALLQGYSIRELLPTLVALLAFAAILLPLGLWSFSLAVRRAKMEGSLAQF